MSKHTPGPNSWTYSGDRRGAIPFGDGLASLHVIYGGPGKGLVAYARTEDSARLIAAAPDLLAACQEAAEYGALTWAHDSENEPNCYRELRAAIAKATGENT